MIVVPFDPTVAADQELRITLAEQPVVQPVHEPVDRDLLAPSPGVADDRRLADVLDLVDDVQLAQPVDPIGFGQSRQRRLCRRAFRL